MVEGGFILVIAVVVVISNSQYLRESSNEVSNELLVLIYLIKCTNINHLDIYVKLAIIFS